MPGLRPRLTATELLRRYSAGERAFSGVDLSGEALRGADLAGIDLSGCDLRSTDLCNANLRGANLTDCRMGRLPRWWLLHIFLALAIGLTLGLFFKYNEQIKDSISSWPEPIRLAIMIPIVLIMIISPLAYLASCVPQRITASFVFVPLSGFVLFAILDNYGTGKTISITLSILLVLFIWGRSWRTIRKAGGNPSLWKGESYWLARLGSTNLEDADLTDADLSRIEAWSARFVGARLMRTRFAGAIDLDGAKFDQISSKVTDLARTLDGNGKDYHGQRLAQISLAGADLKRANLQGCELQGANLRGAQLDEADLTRAYVDLETYKQSGWTGDDLLALHRRGVLLAGLEAFPEEVRTQLFGAQEGLTLYFNTRLVAWDQYLVNGVIFGVLGTGTDCQVAEFRNLTDRAAAVVRLVARRREDLERVAEALYRRVWEQEQDQQTALFKLASLAQGKEIREGLSDLMGRRLERMELREGDAAVRRQLIPADRAPLRWALALGPGDERFEGVRPRRLLLHHAPEDHAHAHELRKHLTLLQRQGLVATAMDPLPGDDRAAELQARLDEADVMLALLSADYFASEICQQQLRQALQRRHAGGLCIVPVLLRPVDWADSPLSGLHPLPADEHPIAQSQDRDAAWQAVITGLRRLLRERL